MTRPIACYVVACPAPCDHAKVAETRRPEWGDIVAPPDAVELDDGMGSTVCSKAKYSRKDEA